ncbi:transcriptional regulator, LuxR family [Catenulispora acidiphila DSM 44928]|uniref:Transcriptional regulator, LuxR family n=1 Tax=Catenulispora acidiphila (strain DSM 44928 / JCM 14897 / NBRC 102108 / NRRL B-24433 / ID139908) TaxID=479433 RepID=C7PZQ6_CATAD|nr:LuxR family transcriptional regulator [Catenulispora acidiphila]ACU73571.1 transcriptional regulator, LuxR family [Catenulispora acidiphila DSM 44928]
MAVPSRHAEDHTETVAWSGAGFAFVGRERELGLLLAGVRHPPAVVLVEGEAGIGKSRLVHEAAAAVAAAGRRVLTGLCHPLREPYPYGPVIDALRKAGDWLPPVADLPPSAGVLAPLLPDLAARLPAAPRPAADAHAKRFQLVNGLRSFLAALGPAVLVVEDAHWIDEATRELLLLLTRDMPEQLSLVLTYRNEDLPPGGSVLGPAYRRQPGVSGAAIHLNPLSGPDVQALAHAALGPHATVELSTVLYQRSEGLPLAAEEDLITLAERGPGEGPDPPGSLLDDLAHAEVPRGLREAFTERLSALSAAARTVVEAAAVLDVPAAEQLLARVADLEPEQASRGLTEALGVAVLQETDTDRYFFRHVLAQRVAYEQMPGPLRARLHRRAIAVLETRSPPPLVQIAHHSQHLGDPQAWLERAEAAAWQAIGLGDSGTAAALLHQILEQPGVAGDRRSRAALALGVIAVNGVDYVTDARALRRILADPQLPIATRGEIRLSLGLLMVNHAGDRAGFREVRRAAEELADRPDRAARAMVALAMNERDENGVRAWEWMERADAEAARCPDPAVSAAAQATRLTLLAREGDPGVWALTDQLPRTSADDEVMRQSVRALYNTGELAIELGHDRRAARMLHESRDLATRVSFPRMECYSRIALLRLDALAGDWEDVENRFTGLCSEYPDIAMAKTDEALTVGQVAAARGLRARAAELFTAAAAYGEMESQVTAGLRAAAGLIAVRLAADAEQDAWAIAEPAVATLRRAGAWARGSGLVPAAVEAALACGYRDAAERLVADAEDGLRDRDAPAATAELCLARGLLKRGSDDAAAAVRDFESARQQWSDIGRPYESAQACERLGVALSASGDGEAAGVRLTEALAAYDRLGAAHDAARCRHTLRDLGLVKAAGRGRRGYGDELSPRERQVAELVAGGATNHDIAEALFLSPRTVEQHVARMLRKLGTTRAGVASVLRGRERQRG